MLNTIQVIQANAGELWRLECFIEKHDARLAGFLHVKQIRKVAREAALLCEARKAATMLRVAMNLGCELL